MAASVDEPHPMPREMTTAEINAVSVDDYADLWRKNPSFACRACAEPMYLHPFTNRIWGCKRCRFTTACVSIYFVHVEGPIVTASFEKYDLSGLATTEDDPNRSQPINQSWRGNMENLTACADCVADGECALHRAAPKLFHLLDLVVAEWKSDPLSAQHFDAKAIVTPAMELVERLRKGGVQS